MIRAVVDTNVLASGFVRTNPQAAPVQVVDAWREQHFELISSNHIRSELERTLHSPYFARRLSQEQVAQDLALLDEEAMMTAITVAVSGVATHPEDDLILAAALSAEADYLVTGDTKLQALGSYQGVKIVSPREFIQILDQP